MATSQKTRQCKKGYACGSSCISRSKACFKKIAGAAEELAKQMSDLVKEAAGEQRLEFQPNAPETTSDRPKLKNQIEEQARNAVVNKFGSGVADRLDAISDDMRQATDRTKALQEKVNAKQISREEFTAEKAAIKELRDTAQAEAERVRADIAKVTGLSEEQARARVEEIEFGGVSDPAALATIKENMTEVYKQYGKIEASTFTKLNVTKDDRSAALPNKNLIESGGQDGTSQRVLAHEWAHHVEFSNQNLMNAVQAWQLSRATDRTPKKLKDITGYNYRDDEIALAGDYDSAYIGKLYPPLRIRGADGSIVTEMGKGTEVLPKAIEMTMDGKRLAKKAASDLGHLYLSLAVMANAKRI